jgi:WD40 repeat protein
MRTRRSSSAAAAVKNAHEDDSDQDDVDDDVRVYAVDGVTFDSYEAMVAYKRQRNENRMKALGLLEPKTPTTTKTTTKRKVSPDVGVAQPKTRASKRVAGLAPDGLELSSSSIPITTSSTSVDNPQNAARDRIQQCTTLSLEQAAAASMDSDDLQSAGALIKDLASYHPFAVATKEETVVASMKWINDFEITHVEKLCKERIYSVVVHPSPDKTIVAAGDKQGHVGLWNVTTETPFSFQIHTAPVCSLAWTSNGLLSSSYDGSIRLLDVETLQFQHVYSYSNAAAASNDTDSISGDGGWVQYTCLDQNENIFVSTSIGTALHVDRRTGKPTFHEKLSEKKINTLR